MKTNRQRYLGDFLGLKIPASACAGALRIASVTPGSQILSKIRVQNPVKQATPYVIELGLFIIAAGR